MRFATFRYLTPPKPRTNLGAHSNGLPCTAPIQTVDVQNLLSVDDIWINIFIKY